MHWTRSVALTALAASTLAAAMSLHSCSGPQATTPAAPAAPTHDQMVERGRYLVSSMACVDCHTPGALYGAADTTRMYSGSDLGWAGPWGVVYPRNLTPDSTGLAAWSEDEIAHALQTGNRPDGRQLAPIMPWMSLANLTSQDAHAIAAYLKTLKPVKHKLPDPVPPGKKPTGAFVAFPQPPGWDAMNLPKPPGGK